MGLRGTWRLLFLRHAHTHTLSPSLSLSLTHSLTLTHSLSPTHTPGIPRHGCITSTDVWNRRVVAKRINSHHRPIQIRQFCFLKSPIYCGLIVNVPGTDFQNFFPPLFPPPPGHLLVAGLGDTRAIVRGGKRGGESESVVMTVHHNPADPQVSFDTVICLF